GLPYLLPYRLCARKSLCFLLFSSFIPLLSSSVFFFSRHRPPPRSTLFPYTTLFRSSTTWSPRRSSGRVAMSGPPRTTTVTCSRTDRKSTRLNSSHVSISYAVFCLKKKKKHIDGGDRRVRLWRSCRNDRARISWREER